MFLRRCYRSKDGKRHAYWALVESVRTAKGPRQKVVAYLSEMDEVGRLGVQQIAEGKAIDPQQRMFDAPKPRWVEVDLERVRVENTRSFGGPWLALQIIRKLGLAERLNGLMPMGREDVPWALMSLVLVILRLCDPSSELRIAESLFEQSALADLLGIGAAKINDDRLYRALDRLLPHKTELETHLKQRLGELFDLKYDLLLYDVTSTFFEGEAVKNELAKRGYSRDSRPDCKQVCIALVVSRCGMPLGYELFAGNTADVSTVRDVVTKMEERYGKADRRQKEKAFRQFRHGETDRGGSDEPGAVGPEAFDDGGATGPTRRPPAGPEHAGGRIVQDRRLRRHAGEGNTHVAEGRGVAELVGPE